MVIQIKKTPENSPATAEVSVAENTSASSTPAAPPPPLPPGGQVPVGSKAPPKQEEEEVSLRQNFFMRGVDYILHSPKMCALLFGLPLVAYLTISFVYAFYESQMLSYADNALAEYKYPVAEKYYQRYLARQPADREVLYKLAKVHVYTNQYSKAAPVLSSLSVSEQTPNPEMLFYWALTEVKQNNKEEVLKILNEAFHLDSEYLPAHYLYNLAFMFIAPPNYPLVENRFADMVEKVLAMDENTDIALGHSEEMHHARRVFFHRFPTQLRRALPLPFTELQEETLINESINLSLSPEGFNNTYYVPTHDSHLLGQRLSAKEGVILMRSVAALMAGDPDSARTHLGLLESGGSLFYDYLQGYLSVLDNDYETAAKFYDSALRAERGLADGIVLRANARWVLSGGAKPTAKDISDYEKALSLEQGNVIAVNNLAFLYVCRGEVEKARRLLEGSEGKANLDKYITANLALLKIDRADLKKAVSELRALSVSYPDLPIIIDALLWVLKLQGKNVEAIKLLKQLRKQKSEHDTPEVALEIARLYRDRNQPLLIVAELSEAVEKFPANRDIIAELLLEYARQKRNVPFLEVLASVEDEQDFLQDPRVLVAKAYINTNAAARRMLFEEAVTSAATVDEKNKALTGWARWLLDNREVSAVTAVMAKAEEVNAGQLSPPLQAALMRLEALAERGDAEQAAALQAAEAFLTEYPHLELSALLDIAWVFIHLDEPERAIDLVADLNYSASGAVNVLDALRAAYINMGDADKAETIDRHLELIKKGAEGAERESEAVIEDLDVIVGRGVGEKIVRQLNEALRDNDYHTAIEMYTKIIDRDIEVEIPALTYQNRGALYIQINRYEPAVKDFEKALALGGDLNNEQLGSILYNYGYALFQLEQYPKSLEFLQKAIDIAPKNVDALSLYALTLERKQSYKSLVDIYQKIITLAPRRINAYQSLSRVYHFLERSEDAISTLKKALEIQPRNKDLHRSLAEMYILTGENDKAQEHLDIIKSI